MNTQELLLDWLDTLAARLIEEIEDTSVAAFTWQPDATANSIALTLWHIGRAWDVLTVRVLHQGPVIEEIWQQAGWRQRTGYDPTGKGWDGLGNLAGYTPAEVAEVPKQTKEELLTYLQQVYQPLRAAVAKLEPDELFTIVEEQSLYDWISNFLRDGYEHLGEIKAIKAMWQRFQ